MYSLRRLLAMIAEVFAEECDRLIYSHLDCLLSREYFWAIAAFAGDNTIGEVRDMLPGSLLDKILPSAGIVSCPYQLFT